jgi:hypothetical protein
LKQSIARWDLRRTAAPEVPGLPDQLVGDLKNQKWVRNPIDAFVLQRLEREAHAR